MPGARSSRIAGFTLACALGGLGACATPKVPGPAPLVVPTGGTFALEFGRNHGPNLTVSTPDGRWMVLVEGGVLNGLMTEQAFLATARLEIDTRSLRGVTFAEGEEIVEPVFTLPGRYDFVISDSLETDAAKLVSATMRVEYE
jgi:hypothetical protein